MPFISDDVERQIVNEFARICGVKPDEVEYSVSDRAERQAITMRCHTQFKDEVQDAELTIEMVERNKFNFIGKITVTGKATRTRDIAQTYSGTPQSLVLAMRKVLSIAKVKKSGLLSKYFGF